MRVLVVEDETRMARLLKRGVEEEGHAVGLAADGPEGLWLSTENPYAAIVLDVMLPGFDGFELCRKLRAAGVWVPVLMLTARDAVDDRVRGLDAGADDYLVKPFSLLELAARLRALARRDDRSRPVILAEDDLRLDPAAKRAWRAGAELHLSPTEFALREFFLRHPGRVLTRSQIIEDVWAPSAGLPGGDYLIQVIDPGGRVRGASGDAGAAPLVSGVQLSRARQGRFGLPAIAGQVERLADGYCADPGLLRRWLGQVEG